MSIIRFYSDPHFGHTNMAIKRGFNSADEMDNHIITEWNKVVSKKDVTYILGDITMEKNNYEVLNRLNGIKKIIGGNHDELTHSKSLINYCNGISGVFYYKDKLLGLKVILTHIPIHPSELEFRSKFNIHGHVHENSLPDKRYINVCAEVIDYKPKRLIELI